MYELPLSTRSAADTETQGHPGCQTSTPHPWDQRRSYRARQWTRTSWTLDQHTKYDGLLHFQNTRPS